jgi:hypothetical protein
MPCGDEDEHFCSNKTICLNTAHPQHSTVHDCCSPFCSCSCCGNIIAFSKLIIDIKSYSIPHPITFEFSKELNTISASSIWRPPKFC